MKTSRYWVLFAACSAGWLVISLLLAPTMCGADVYNFRDAGWNLAQWGSFESAALMYMPGLTPRLFAHYTPIMPLLFAAYLYIFPRNAYAGTVFNLLLGLAAAAVSLRWVLLQPAGRLRQATAVAIATLPVLFITYDRPEAIALVLFAATIAYASRPGCRPVFVGLLIALTFMAHPYASIAAAVWASALFLSHNWNHPRRGPLTLRQIAVAGASALVPLILAALIYYSLDRESLSRFAAHSLGNNSGLRLHDAGSGGLLQALRRPAFGLSALGVWTYLGSLASTVLLTAWAILRRRQLQPQERLPIAAGAACTLISIFLLPVQANYIFFLAFTIPLGLLIVCRQGSRLVAPALALLLLAMLFKLPSSGPELLQRIEQVPSYRAARFQPSYLRAQIASPDAIVAVEGGSYDLYKPEFHRMIRLKWVEDPDHFQQLAAVANCYSGFQGADNEVRPLPDKLNAAEFRLIQTDPQHMWVTLFGHKIMRAQWGYGCDLYLRSGAVPAGQTAAVK